MSEPSRRKLTTILSADVAGYSRLMDRDEVGTLDRLIAYRKAMEGLIARHHGRLVNTAGDSILAEFGSVVEAVQCAAEFQQELDQRNGEIPEEERMRFRIGINLGDVIQEGTDLYGEGVNIAARLQEMSEPGGICISGTAYDQVRNKLSLGYEFLGERHVKNITDDVPVYRVELEAGETPKSGDGSAGSGGDGPRPRDVAFADAEDPAARRTARWVYILFLISLVFGILAVASSDHGFGEQARVVEGDLDLVTSGKVAGKVGGTVTVAPGIEVRFVGKIEGNLIIGPDAVVDMKGKIEGDVLNHGGVFRFDGALEGSERQLPRAGYGGPAAVTPQTAGGESEGDTRSGPEDPAGFFSSVLFVLSLGTGVVLAYRNRGGGPAWIDTHYLFQIRTFWLGCLWVVVGLVLTPIVVGLFVLLLVPFWLFGRIVKGWRCLSRGEPHPKPTSWLMG